MNSYLKPLSRPERIYVSKGLIIQSRCQPDYLLRSQPNLERSMLIDDSPILPKEGLIVRLRAKKRQPRRRCFSDMRGSPLPDIHPAEKSIGVSPGPVLKPKKAKSSFQVRSTSVLHPAGPYLEPSKYPDHLYKKSPLPTMMMLKLIKPKAKRPTPLPEFKPSPHLKLVTIECPEELSHIHKRPASLPRGLNYSSSLIESHFSSVRQLTMLSLKERTSSSSPYQERVDDTPLRPLSRKKRKVVFVKRDEMTGEPTDRDCNLTLESYYM